MNASMDGDRSGLFSWLSIFTSAGTLVCCALPAALVAVGAGASLASLVGVFPQLVWLSEHKGWVFGVAGVMLALAGVAQYRARFAPCPVEPKLASQCLKARRVSRRVYYVSVAIFAVGLFFAFGAAQAQAMEMKMEMQSAFGPYPMTREGSGTSWQPDDTPMDGLMFHQGDWMLMAHGFGNVVYDHQGGPRGDTKSFFSSMAMGMASRPLGPGTLGLRAMLSLDPTMGRGGYPLLFQTGETADGLTHLVDRQHPHDAFMELAGSYSLPVGDKGSVFLYAGLPGEPALGPSTFMHRFSGMRNPEAPLTHHWLDSTHITMGVVTLGASHGPWQVEASRFNGREPDQNRWNIETRAFDSSSARVSFNPTPALSLQVSYGDLKSPEQLEPEMRVKRTTASASFQSSIAGRPWGSTLAWGRNDKSGHGAARKVDGWLLESTAAVSERGTVFGRIERVENDELFADDHPLHGQVFTVGKLTLGYIHEVAKTGAVTWSVGGLASAFSTPSDLDPYYGARPRAYMLFLQARL